MLLWVRVMVLNDTLNNISVISWRLVLLVEEAGVPGENHWPAASHWQTLTYNILSTTLHERDYEPTTLVMICTDCIGRSKSNYVPFDHDHDGSECYGKHLHRLVELINTLNILYTLSNYFFKISFLPNNWIFIYKYMN